MKILESMKSVKKFDFSNILSTDNPNSQWIVVWFLFRFYFNYFLGGNKDGKQFLVEDLIEMWK